MKVAFIWVGKTNEKYLETGMQLFIKRIKHYTSTEFIEIKDIKKFANSQDLKEKEGQEILSKLQNEDVVILCDASGENPTSIGLSEWILHYQNIATKRVVLIIGGAFGFSDAVYSRANRLLSLSKLTFSHQMVRLFLLEQIYRAFTILRNEKYHNE